MWVMLCRADLPSRLLDASCGEAGGGGEIEQMTLRLMLCVLILLALGGCQNPSRIQAASSVSVAMD